MRGFLPFILLLCFCTTCKPKEVPPVEEGAPSPAPAVDTSLKCETIPHPSTVFGWKDSIPDLSKNILSFAFNPANSNEIICVVQGDLNNYNQMYTLDLLTRKKTILANLGEYPPSVNQQGWITFSSIDENIFMIKSNGDSLTMITSNNISVNPHWDFSGKRIYYFVKAYLVQNAYIGLANPFGKKEIINLYTGVSQLGCFNKSHKLLYVQATQAQATLIMHDVSKIEDKIILSRPVVGSEMPFNNLCADQNDENVYWSNSKGIFKCNLASSSVDTVLKNCPNYNYRNPIMSYRLNEMTVTRRVLKPLKNDILLHTFKAFELNLVSRKQTEIRIFD